MTPLNGRAMERFENISLKNKILFSILAIILMMSFGSALVTRAVLVSSMTEELRQRGVAIARSVADTGRGYILTEDYPNLTSLLFDAARLEERKQLIAYIFILDDRDHVIAHNFIRSFPEGLIGANAVTAAEPYSIRLLHLEGMSAYDIGVPILEGIYEIGTVHVGLDKQYIDGVIANLRITYLGILSSIVVIFFLVSRWLSKYITRPIWELTQLADEISRGNLDAKSHLGSRPRCWEMLRCQEYSCPAHHNIEVPCWYVDGTEFTETPTSKFPEKLQVCYDCVVYKRRARDEVKQLADSLMNMTYRLKASQQRLQESEEKYRSLFTSGPNPIFVLDRGSLDILDANPSAEDVYGYERHELVGRSFAALACRADGWTEIEFFRPDSEGNVRWSYSKVCHYRKGEDPFYVNIHAVPSKVQDRDVMIVAVTDVTEMIEKDAQLIQASKMSTLGEMSAGIAHELNQPLNAIKMGSEFLQMMLEKGETVSKQDLDCVAKEVSGQVDRATGIIKRLREFGRKADFAREKIDINLPIHNVHEMIERQLIIQNITMELDLTETLPLIYGHVNRLEQVIFNLIANARDAINQKPESGGLSGERRIRVRSFLDQGRVAVSVSDTGIGIPEALRRRIFDAFFTTKRMGQGMGLGLSISHGIVKDYGGEISFESEEGVGTTFTMTFPQAGV